MGVNAESPYKTLADFVAAARAEPGKLNFGTGGPGSLSRLGAEILAREAGLKMMHVPYNGGIASINALLGKQISVVVADIQPAPPQIKFVRLRAPAVTRQDRSPSLPDVPPFGEGGFTGLVA